MGNSQVAADHSPSDAKSAGALVLETVAGTGSAGVADAPLDRCTFNGPFGMCRHGDSLFVAEYLGQMCGRSTACMAWSVRSARRRLILLLLLCPS
jgi:hypothetical protein